MSDRICSRCSRILPAEAFHFRDKNKSRLQSACKECVRAYCAAYYQANAEKVKAVSKISNVKQRRQRRQRIAVLRDRPCVDCGGVFPACCMEFDHRSGTEKRASIARIGAVSEEKFLAELAKCDLVCANCHRQRTAKRRQSGWGKNRGGAI